MIPEHPSREMLRFCRSIKAEELAGLPFRKTIFEGIPNAWLAEQAALQKLASSKLPEWYANEMLLYPDRQALEQCTSGLLAAWKKTILPEGISLVADASAGLGVDAFGLGADSKLILFEPDTKRAQALRNNAAYLHAKPVEVREAPVSASELQEFARAGSAFLLYADPDRRHESGSRKFDWKQCEPDVRTFHSILKETGSRMLIKFSPLDDPEEIAAAMPGATAVYILSLHNEVKEVLMLWDFSVRGETIFEAVDLRRSGEVQRIRIPVHLEGRPDVSEVRAGHFLLDPLASLRKGRFAACLAEEQGWLQLSARARLYMTDKMPDDFPGRVFQITGMYASPKAFRKAFTGNNCHVVTRDFPVPADELRKSLKLKEDGEDFLFCFSDERGNRQVLHTRRC